MRSGVVPAALLALTLMLTGCQAGPPQPPPSSRPVMPPSIDPAVPTVHFTAQGDVGVGTGARQVLDTIAGLRPQLNLGLGDYSYEAGIEQEFCDMVTGKLGD